MQRRSFVAGLACFVAFPPFAAQAKNQLPTIGILDPGVPWLFDAFNEGMRGLGYVEGQNIVYAVKSLRGKDDILAASVAELVASQPDVVVTVAPFLVHAVRRASPATPIVFLASGDPISAGLVESFAHPGGRTTGLSFADEELSTKRLDLLRQLVPGLSELAVFYSAAVGRNSAFETTARIAGKMGVQIRAQPVTDLEALDGAFRDAAGAHVQGIDVLASPIFNANRERLIELAEQYRLPAMYESGEYVRAGGLIAYGPVFVDMARRGAALVDKILKGADPGDIPVEVATKFSLSLNLKAAKALALDIPPTLLAAADEVIE